MVTGQAELELAQRYGLFGTIVTIIQVVAIYLLIIQVGYQTIYYGGFIIRGNRSLKYDRVNNEIEIPLQTGIIPYINIFYKFFKRYSKGKSEIDKSVNYFLFLNFFFGLLVISLFTQLLPENNVNFLLPMVIIFLLMIIFWIINLMTSIKIRKEVMKWENLFPKLEEWAEELEKINSENSVFTEEEIR